MSDLNGQIWYRVMSGPHIEEVLVVKETAHKITEQIDYMGRKTLRIHNKKSSYDQYVATPGEVRKIIEEMISTERNSITYMEERILKTKERVKKMEEQLESGSFPITRLRPYLDSKSKVETITL